MSRPELTADLALAGAVRRHSIAEPGSSILTIADALVGLHNTTPVGPYLSLRARSRVFARTELDELMWGDWALARFRAMRLTMFVFPSELLEIAAAATRRISDTLAERWLRDSAFTSREFDGLADAIDDALADGPLTVRELRGVLGVQTGVDVPGVVGRMCDVGRLVGGAPQRNWRSAVRRYHRWRDVLPAVDLGRWDEASAITELIRRYVASYGPVTVDDMAWWTGLTKARCREAVDTLGGDVECVDVDGWKGPLYRDAASAVTSDVGSRVSALPVLDPYVQGYRDRGRFLDPSRWTCVYDGGGNAAATLVHRGRIIGVWQTSIDPVESVRYHLFDRPPKAVRAAAEADVVAAGSMYFDHPVDAVEIAQMEPLNAGGGRSAFHPLDAQVHRASRRKPADT